MKSIVQNQPTNILSHYISYQRDCKLFNELVTHATAFYPDIKNIIHYIAIDAIISVKVRETGRQWYRQKGVYDFVYETTLKNGKKTVKKLYESAPNKLPIIKRILLKKKFSTNAQLNKQEFALFKSWYVDGLSMDSIALAYNVKISEVKKACTKAVNYFADVYKLSKIIALDPIKQEPVLLEQLN